MSINRLYPICHQDKPSLTKEFFSGFFYLGRNKYVRLPSDPKELKLQKDVKKNICLQNALKISLYITGIIPLIAGIYKLIEVISLARKKIILIEKDEKSELQKKILSPISEPAEETKEPLENSSSEVNKEIKIEITNAEKKETVQKKLKPTLNLVHCIQPMTKEEVENRIQEQPLLEEIYINRDSALNEYLWIAEILQKNPQIKLEFENNQEDWNFVLEKNKVEALKIYVSRSQPFAEFFIYSTAEVLKQQEVPQIKECFLDIVLSWGQEVNLKKYQNATVLVEPILYALSFVNDPYVETRVNNFERLMNFVLEQGNSLQKVQLMDVCVKHPLLTRCFAETVTVEQLQEIKDHFQVPGNVDEKYKNEKGKEDFLQKKFCLLLKNSGLCEGALWIELKPILDKFIQVLPYFTKEHLLEKMNTSLANDSNDYLRAQEAGEVFRSLNLMYIENLLENESTVTPEKLKAAYEFTIRKAELEFGENFYAEAMTQFNLSENNIPMIFKSFTTKNSVLIFLNSILESEDPELIEKVFKWYLPHRTEIDRLFPTHKSLALILESIDTPQKASAIYKACPNEEIKKALTEGIKYGTTHYKTKVSKNDLEKILK